DRHDHGGGRAAHLPRRSAPVANRPADHCARLIWFLYQIANKEQRTKYSALFSVRPEGTRFFVLIQESFRLLDAVEAKLVGDDVERAALDLIVDAADILADDAEGDQLDAAEEQDGDQGRR